MAISLTSSTHLTHTIRMVKLHGTSINQNWQKKSLTAPRRPPFAAPSECSTSVRAIQDIATGTRAQNPSSQRHPSHRSPLAMVTPSQPPGHARPQEQECFSSPSLPPLKPQFFCFQSTITCQPLPQCIAFPRSLHRLYMVQIIHVKT